MTLFRWTWLVLASLFLLAGVFVFSRGFGSDLDAIMAIYIGTPLFSIGAISLGVFLLRHGPSTARLAWWIVLVVGTLPLLWFVMLFLFRFL